MNRYQITELNTKTGQFREVCIDALDDDDARQQFYLRASHALQRWQPAGLKQLVGEDRFLFRVVNL